MIYISHYSDDREFQKLVDDYGVGIETVCFAVGDNLDNYEKHLEEFTKRLNCKHINLHGPFLDLNPASYDSKIEAASQERFQLTYEIAQKLNADRIIYHSCFLPNVYFIEGWADRMAEFWNRFLEDKDDSIKICMENVLEIEYLPVYDVAQKVDHPAFSICLDVGHAHCYSKYGIDEWINMLGDKIGHVHLHDNDGSWDQHLALGKGSIDWKMVFSLLERYGIDSYTIENQKAERYYETFDFLSENFPNVFSQRQNI